MGEYKYFQNETVTYFEPLNKQSFDLFLCFCGIEACPPRHSYDKVRSQYLIHYILDGEGTYKVNDKTYHLKKNQGFLITPETQHSYQADEQNPWTYIWIGFNGVKAAHYLNYANLNKENLIFECQDSASLYNCVKKMFELNADTPSNELEIQSLLYLFLSKLASNNANIDLKHRSKVAAEGYLEQSIEFINNYYMKPIKINDIASYIGVNRSYLTSIFKQKLNISPQEFLMNFRMEKASHQLMNSNQPINEIAKSVGYPDPFAFSKVFRKIYGKSPKQYRETK